MYILVRRFLEQVKGVYKREYMQEDYLSLFFNDFYGIKTFEKIESWVLLYGLIELGMISVAGVYLF